MNASDSYFKRKRQGRAVSMEFPFPQIAAACPICGGPCGAIYRGYYQRGALCPSALFVGFVAIRTGFCKAEQCRFALFPDFLIPFRSFSRAAFVWLWEAWKRSPRELGASVDRWWDGLEREISISISTLDSQLRFIVRQFYGGHTHFGIPASSVVTFAPTLCGSLGVPVCVGSQVILHPAFGSVGSLRIDPPP